MRRLFAILGAALMIVGALVLRGRIDGNGSGTLIDGAGPGGTLVCVTELRAVCDRIGRDHPDVTVRVQDAGITADALIDRAFDASATPIDAWLTLAPFPDLVRIGRELEQAAPVFDTPSHPLARSPIAVLAFEQRAERLRRGTCSGAQLDWGCLGDAAGRPWDQVGGEPGWGSVRVGLPAPDASATGLLSLAQGTAVTLGRADYSRFDLDSPDFRDWASRLGANRTDVPNLGAAITQMPSSNWVVASTEAAAGPTRSRLPNPAPFGVTLTEPKATADVVVVGRLGSPDSGSLRSFVESDAVLDALAADGWRVAGRPVAAGVADGVLLPATNGLPDSGVLYALREAWIEVA